ncbi:MAG: Uncharacterized protein G01um101466_51 [Parcubacteria group bacterium Gr01-1014_66]|nr:MAG: Uncharacterized protein G01um101466_51 [Parcubacteria group bacterium Gr01-1014_66]
MHPHNSNYQDALQLSLNGSSYGEIKNFLGIPKSTQSYWFKDLELPAEAKKLLKKKQGNGLKALALFNNHRTKAIQKENEETRMAYEMRIVTLCDRELMLIGASLYWAEGQKLFHRKRANILIFVFPIQILK